MLSNRFYFIWPSIFRGKDLLEVDKSKTRIACGGHVYQRIGAK